MKYTEIEMQDFAIYFAQRVMKRFEEGYDPPLAKYAIENWKLINGKK